MAKEVFAASEVEVVVFVDERGILRERQTFPDGSIFERNVAEMIPCEVGQGMISAWLAEAQGKPDGIIRQTSKLSWRVEMVFKSRGQFPWSPIMVK